jgi:hypothetical protein
VDLLGLSKRLGHQVRFTYLRRKNMRGLKMAFASALVLGLLVGNSWAAKAGKESPAPKKEVKEVKGTVEVTRDKAGAITDITLKTGKVMVTKYKITLDEKGKELGEKMTGKQVEVKGTVEKRSGVKWLTVTQYSESASKPAKKAAKTK